MASMSYKKWEKFEDDDDDDPMTRALNATRARTRTLPQLAGTVRAVPESSASGSPTPRSRPRHTVDVISDPN